MSDPARGRFFIDAPKWSGLGGKRFIVRPACVRSAWPVRLRTLGDSIAQMDRAAVSTEKPSHLRFATGTAPTAVGSGDGSGSSLMFDYVKSDSATMRAITQGVFFPGRPQPNPILAIRLGEITLKAANLPTGCSRLPSLQLLFWRQRAAPVVALASAQNRKYHDDRCEEQNIEAGKDVPKVFHKLDKPPNTKNRLGCPKSFSGFDFNPSFPRTWSIQLPQLCRQCNGRPRSEVHAP